MDGPADVTHRVGRLSGGYAVREGGAWGRPGAVRTERSGREETVFVIGLSCLVEKGIARLRDWLHGPGHWETPLSSISRAITDGDDSDNGKTCPAFSHLSVLVQDTFCIPHVGTVALGLALQVP